MKKKILLGSMALFVVIQFIQPDKSNPPIDPARTFFEMHAVPEDIQDQLRKSCFDCHSHETVWPWYSYVAPVSWLIGRDVTEGREHLNFSDWARYSTERAGEKLAQIGQMVSEKEMPLPIYLPLHSEARLSDTDRKKIADWAEEAMEANEEESSHDRDK